MTSFTRAVLIVLSLALSSAALASDSPQFRGPARDGVYPADGLLASWPEGGPAELWSADGLGQGFASVSVADGRLYTTGATGNQGYVFAFDTAGRPLWKRGYGELHSGAGYPGTRTTPTYHEGRLYLVSSMGRAAAFDAETGEVRWQVDLADRFGARNIRWGITESPLIVDDKVIFTPGGSSTVMVALDKKTGETVWTTAGLDDKSGYCSPRLFDNGKVRQIVTLTAGHLIGVDASSGALAWSEPYKVSYGIHAVSPIFHGDSIYVSDGYKQGGKMFTLGSDGKSVTLKWQDENLDVHHGGAVLVGGHIYGASTNGTWYALDAATGEVKASIRRAGKGSVVYAGGRLYGYTEQGEVLLVDPDPANFAVLSRFKVRRGDGHHWAHPVIADGVLYIRHGDALTAYALTAGDG